MASKPTNAQEANDDNRILEGVETGEELSPALAALYDELQIADGAARSKVFIYLQNSDNEFERVFEGKPEEYNLMQTARKFGSGAYRVTLYGPNAIGRGSVRGSELFRIRFDPEEEARIKAKNQAPVATAQQAQPDMEAMMMRVVSMMPRQPDIVETLLRIAPVITPLITALKGNPVPPAALIPPKSAVDRLTEAVTVATLGKQLRDVLDDGVTGGGDDDVIKTGMAVFDRLRDMQAGRPSDPVQRALEPEAPAQQPRPPVTIEQQPVNLEIEEMNIQIAAIRLAARMGKDHREAAEKIYDNAPDMIVNALCAPDWLAGLRAVIPDCDAQIGWYTSVRDELVKIAQEENKLTPAKTKGKRKPK